MAAEFKTSTEPGDLELSSLVWRLAMGIALLFAIIAALGYLLSGTLETIAAHFVGQFGLMGVLVGCLLMDSVPGLTHEPLLLFGYSGGLGYWEVFAAASVGSVLAGPVGWFMGRALGGAGWVQALFVRYRVSYFLHHYGVTAIAVAAMTPFPFAIATWSAGAAGVSLSTVFIGSLFRVPKVLFYLSVIVLGWSTFT